MHRAATSRQASPKSHLATVEDGHGHDKWRHRKLCRHPLEVGAGPHEHNDKKLPAECRRNYKGVGDALAQIAREDGILALFTGAPVTVLR